MHKFTKQHRSIAIIVAIAVPVLVIFTVIRFYANTAKREHLALVEDMGEIVSEATSPSADPCDAAAQIQDHITRLQYRENGNFEADDEFSLAMNQAGISHAIDQAHISCCQRQHNEIMSRIRHSLATREQNGTTRAVVLLDMSVELTSGDSAQQVRDCGDAEIVDNLFAAASILRKLDEDSDDSWTAYQEMLELQTANSELGNVIFGESSIASAAGICVHKGMSEASAFLDERDFESAAQAYRAVKSCSPAAPPEDQLQPTDLRRIAQGERRIENLRSRAQARQYRDQRRRDREYQRRRSRSRGNATRIARRCADECRRGGGTFSECLSQCAASHPDLA